MFETGVLLGVLDYSGVFNCFISVGTGALLASGPDPRLCICCLKSVVPKKVKKTILD